MPASHRPGKKPRVERKSARPQIPVLLRPLACNGCSPKSKSESMYFTTLSTPCSGAQKDLDLTREENKNKKSIDSRSHTTRPRKTPKRIKIKNIDLLEWLDSKNEKKASFSPLTESTHISQSEWPTRNGFQKGQRCLHSRLVPGDSRKVDF